MAFTEKTKVSDVATVGLRKMCKSTHETEGVRCRFPAGHDGLHYAVIGEDKKDLYWGPSK